MTLNEKQRLDRLIEIRETIKKHDEMTKALRQEREAIELDIYNEWETSGRSQVKQGGSTFYMATDTYASCPAENREALIEYAREAGVELGTVNSQKLKSYIKEVQEEGGDLDPQLESLITTFTKNRIRIRKG
jgi:hypothetical protein